MAKYIVIKHEAKKRGIHHDIRFEKPNSRKWASFATTKKDTELPTKPGKRITLVRTHDHNEKEATFTGEIKSGYGAGTLKKVDSGKCDIEKFSNSHIVVNFDGDKLNGKYHFVNTKTFGKSEENKNIFIFFKSKK